MSSPTTEKQNNIRRRRSTVCKTPTSGRPRLSRAQSFCSNRDSSEFPAVDDEFEDEDLSSYEEDGEEQHRPVYRQDTFDSGTTVCAQEPAPPPPSKSPRLKGGSEQDLEAQDPPPPYVPGKQQSAIARFASHALRTILLKNKPAAPVPPERTVCPEHSANILSRMYFSWMTPIMSKGYRRELELNDIWKVNPNREVEPLLRNFTSAYREAQLKEKSNPLLKALHSTFMWEFWFGGVAVIVTSLCQVFSPFVLRYLISYVSEAFAFRQEKDKLDATGADDGILPGSSFARGLGLVMAIYGLQLLQSLGTNHFLYSGAVVGGQVRGVLIASIAEKAMRLSPQAKAGNLSGNDVPDRSSFYPGKKKGRKSLHLLHQDKVEDAEKNSTKKKSKSKEPSAWPDGRILNMMSTDTSRIDAAFGMFHLVWASPISICIAIGLLVSNLGLAALAGAGFIFFGVPVMLFLTQIIVKRRREIGVITDSRVSLTTELLMTIRFVKLYGWEAAFLDKLTELRKVEISRTRKALASRNGLNVFSVSIPIIASMLSFIVYSSKNTLTADRVFSSLALFNAIRVPCNLLPQVIGQIADAYSCFGKLESFLDAQEWKDSAATMPNIGYALRLKHADFTWEQAIEEQSTADSKSSSKSSKRSNAESIKSDDNSSIISKSKEPFKLQDIDVEVGYNELIAVIGNVGSGKSSLLSAIAGDMRITAGRLLINNVSRAFCSQQAWIYNATLRDNILFGKPYDPVWYEQVTYACALQQDFDMMPAGDQTEIGERGINMSGGQKQRVNLARSIYARCEIVLLDDPLSAVDPHVGRHIFKHAIRGLLRNTCVILATHQVHILPQCDRILWLEGGEVKDLGTHSEVFAKDEQASVDENRLSFQSSKTKVAPPEDDEDDARPIARKPIVEKDQSQEAGVSLISKEEQSSGSVPWSLYIDYVRASGSLVYGIIPLVLLALAQISTIMTTYWLSWWVAQRFRLTRNQYIFIYAGLAMGQFCLLLVFYVSVSMLGTASSRTMLQRAMEKVFKAPMSFFDTTPLGRITNRFSKDVDVMDNLLTEALRMYLYSLTLITSIFILFIISFHYSAAALCPMLVCLVLAAGFYRASARQIKRYESSRRSVMFARFAEAIAGVSSIRSYGIQVFFASAIRKSIDDLNGVYFLTFANQRWLNMRLDALTNGLVLVTGLLIVGLRFSINPATSGLVFSYMLSNVSAVQLLVKQLAEVESAMNATERLQYYGSQLPQESSIVQKPGRDIEVVSRKPLAEDWPQHGSIIMENVKMRYREGLPLALQGINMHIYPGERIGVVGRTGAGKSSLSTALFRLVELAEGTITIDGHDISQLHLHDVRSRLSVLPQDPALFKGTIRTNLDPFLQHNDLDLWDALRRCQLAPQDGKASTENRDSHVQLDMAVEDSGANLSLGQRQLLALARVLLRRSRIVICDEATSSLDAATDHAVQETMRNAFQGKTVFTVAHRLRTIIHYDRVCVLGAGAVLEIGAPLELWESGGHFRSMCDESKITRDDFFY